MKQNLFAVPWGRSTIRNEYSFSNTVCWKSTTQNPAFSKSEIIIIFKKF